MLALYTFSGLTFASLHRFFISLQMFVLLSGLPVRVIKIQPDSIFCSVAKRSSFFCSALTIKTLLRLPLQKTNASPFLTDSTVMNFNSLTRIPVPQMVCKIRLRRLLPLLSAAFNNLLYSSLVSSFSSEQKICRCSLMVLSSSIHSRQR